MLFQVTPPDYMIQAPTQLPAPRCRVYRRPVSEHDLMRSLGLFPIQKTPSCCRPRSSDVKPGKSGVKSEGKVAAKQMTGDKVTLDFRGFSPEDIRVKVTDRCVLIRGEQKNDHTDIKITQTVPLPEEVDRRHIRCQYVDGYVTVHLPVATKEEEKVTQKKPFVEKRRERPCLKKEEAGEDKEKQRQAECKRKKMLAKVFSAMFGLDILEDEEDGGSSNEASKMKHENGEMKAGEKPNAEEEKETKDEDVKNEQTNTEAESKETDEQEIGIMREETDRKDEEVGHHVVRPAVSEDEEAGSGGRQDSGVQWKDDENRKTEADTHAEGAMKEDDQTEEMDTPTIPETKLVNGKDERCANEEEESSIPEKEKCCSLEYEVESIRSDEEDGFVRIDMQESDDTEISDEKHGNDSVIVQFESDSEEEEEEEAEEGDDEEETVETDLKVTEILTPKPFSVQLDMSSYRPRDIHVICKDGNVIVEAEREIKGDNYSEVEKISRRIRLPVDVDELRMESLLDKDGVMTIQAPYMVEQRL